MSVRHVVWVNELARLKGGCEYYVYHTVRLLKARGIASTLLYDALQEQASPAMLQLFDQAFPMVDLRHQLRDIRADVLYVHRLSSPRATQELLCAGIPSLRFFHDHKLFCLREHKYKTLTHETCTQPIGPRCYACLGFLNRGTGRLGVRITTVGSLRREQLLNMGFDGYAVGSSYMADHLAAHGFDRGKIHVLPLYSLPADGEKEEVRGDDSLLFVGQLIRGKGLDVLLHALALTQSPARLWVAGTGRQEAMFKQLCDALGLRDRVTFLGNVTHAELGSYYRRAACVVFPARQPETFGLIGPEAMSRSTPVIASNAGGITEWLHDGETGVTVPPNQPRALANAIDRLLADRNMRDIMGKNARIRYEQAFRPEHHVNALMALFELTASRKTT